MTLLEITALNVRIDGRHILGPVNLAVKAGEVVGVVGPNGAGKTTLLRALAGLLPSEHAGYTLLGQPITSYDLRARARAIGYLPQSPTVAWPLSVRELLALGRLPHGTGASGDDRLAVERAELALGLTSLFARDVRTLSGGERMRAHLARLMAGEHRVLLVDEPTVALDPRHQLEVLALLGSLAKAGAAAVLVLHDLALAARYCSRLLVLQEGRALRAGAPASVLDDALLAEVFGIRGLRGVVDGDERLLGISSLSMPAEIDH